MRVFSARRQGKYHGAFCCRAYMIADILTDRALASESVNSLLMLPDGRLEGDNSDGGV